MIVKKTNQICFVLPYFGAFPPWFSGFLLSCGHNPGIHWLILTDIDPLPEAYPENVFFEHLSFQEIQRQLTQLIEVNVSFTTPHKLCDVKPLYGQLFEARLKTYRYWGHCDLDLIWGDITGFLREIDYEQYDVISSRKETISGHFTLYKNTELLRGYFKKVSNYQKAFVGDQYAGFDEGYFAYHMYLHHQADGLKVYWPKKFGVDWGELDYNPKGWKWEEGKILDEDGNERVYLHFMKWKKELVHAESFSVLKQNKQFAINKYGLWTQPLGASLKFKLLKDSLKGVRRRIRQKFTPSKDTPPKDPATIPWEYRIME